jgi:hypothetical protein
MPIFVWPDYTWSEAKDLPHMSDDFMIIIDVWLEETKPQG